MIHNPLYMSTEVSYNSRTLNLVYLRCETNCITYRVLYIVTLLRNFNNLKQHLMSPHYAIANLGRSENHTTLKTYHMINMTK